MQRPVQRRKKLQIDDKALRCAAADLLVEARKRLPAIGAALELVARGVGTPLIEIEVGPRGVATSIVFEEENGAERTATLLELGQA
jgi:hypothetical protein